MSLAAPPAPPASPGEHEHDNDDDKKFIPPEVLNEVMKDVGDIFSGDSVKQKAALGELMGLAETILGISHGDSAAPAQPGLVPELQSQPAKLAEPAKTNIRQDEINDGILASMANVQDAKAVANLQNSDATAQNVTYTTPDGKTQSLDAKGDLNAAIANGTVINIKQQDGSVKHYRKIDGMDGGQDDGTQPTITRADGKEVNTYGAKATAYLEVDEKNQPLMTNGKETLKLSFGGYTDTNIFDTSAQTQALGKVINGDLNPQTSAAAIFTDRVLNEMGRDKVVVNFGSHSLGASNALAAQAMCDVEGVQSSTALLIEPAGASLALRTMKEDLNNNGDFSQTLQAVSGKSADVVKAEAGKLDADVGKKVVSIRMLATDAAGVHGTDTAYLVPELKGRDNFSNKFAGLGHEVQRENERAKAIANGQKIDAAPFLNGENKDNAMIGEQVYQMAQDSDKPAGITGRDQFHRMNMILSGANHMDAVLGVREAMAKFSPSETLSHVEAKAAPQNGVYVAQPARSADAHVKS
jgi:hypothetical protein